MNVHKNYLNVLIKLRPNYGLSLVCETGGTTPVHNVLSVVNIKINCFHRPGSWTGEFLFLALR